MIENADKNERLKLILQTNEMVALAETSKRIEYIN